MSNQASATPKTFFIIPAMPTPNGRLHLGHIGGPFLATDVLARHLQMNGHKTVVLSGTDSFDSYVTWQAEKENITPEEICHKYHDLIAMDFKSMQIGVERFVNPLEPKWFPAYKAWLHLLLKELEDAGAVAVAEETVGVDEANQRYLTGCFLAGFCPICQAEVRGYFCEDCGAHFRPEEVLDATKGSIEKMVQNLFLKLPETFNLEGIGLQKSIKDVYRKFVDQKFGLLRLTANSEWGLPIGDGKPGDRFFNYPFAFAFALMLGEMAGEIAGAGKNALASDSEIVTVAAFGIDNTVPVLGSILGITASVEKYKSFDYYIVNHFFDLNGSKFSTSRRHAIWVDDLINQLGGSSDIVRLYLAGMNTRDQAANFDTAEFVHFYNGTVDWIEKLVVQGMKGLPEQKEFAAGYDLPAKLDELLEAQAACLSPEDFQVHEAVKAIDAWLELAPLPSAPGYFFFLKGLALLCYPFMPRLGQTLWTQLGYAGAPALEGNLTALPALPAQTCLPVNLRRITHAEIEQCSGVAI